MSIDEIYKKLTLNNGMTVYNKKLTEEVTEEYIFGDDEDNLEMTNTEDDFEVTEEDIFGEDIENVNLLCRISELEKENRILKEEILDLKRQLHDLSSYIQNRESAKAPAYRDDINLDELVALYNKGISMNEIGRTLNCSAHTVKRRLRELEIL